MQNAQQQQQQQQAWNRAPDAQAPYFPPPPLAPIRSTGSRPRAAVAAVVGLPPNPRVTVSPPPPSTCESDASSSSTYDAASPPQPRGLRPPPPPRVRSLTAPPAKLAIPTTGAEGQEEDDGISPLLSRAPALLFPPPTTTAAQDGLTSPSDVIPPEHKRIPVPIPRSPVMPPTPPSPPTKPSGLGLGLDFLARRSLRKSTFSLSPTARGSKKQLPPPPIVLVVRRNQGGGWGVAKEVTKEEVEEVVSAKASLGGVSPVVVPPSPAPTKGKKRRTVWEGLVDGWWDLGLLERMGTVRRKR